jgi:hypothetical protein
MDSLTLESIPLQFDLEQICRNLRMKEGNEQVGKLQGLLGEAQSIGKPKAFYRSAFIESRTDHQVVINGIVFTSRVLRVNLEKVHRVFPYVTTCGLELEEWSRSFDDMLLKYWADVLKEMALRTASKYLQDHLIEHYRLVKVSRMNPGSLPDWPLPEQRPLFDLLGNGPGSIGVDLTDSFLMLPIKSVSGIWFPTEESFESCRLCLRENCIGRRAPYDQNLYDRKYGKIKEQ